MGSASKFKVKVASIKKKNKDTVKSEKGNLWWHLSAPVAYETAGNKFEYVGKGKGRQCVVFVLALVESTQRGKVKKRGAHISTQGRVGTPGPLKPAPAPRVVRASPRATTLPGTNMTSEVFNPNPTIIATAAPTARRRAAEVHHSLWLLSDDEDSDVYDSADDKPEPIDADEIFGLFLFLCFLFLCPKLTLLHFYQDLIRSISDPEHRSMSLEQLAVVSAPQITVAPSRVIIEFTPTVPHCGMSTLIGLTIRVRLLRALPSRFKVDIRVKPGSHQSEHAG